MKIATIIGARPQFIKTAVLSREIRKNHTEILIHTGQHYDTNMSDDFFTELNIPKPEYNLAVGSGSQGEQTGRMLAEIEKILIAEKVDWVLIFGDTNSTIAGALAAAKLHIPVAHVEAGLRSFNRRMPEEINRVLSDQISELLFCPNDESIENLRKEGVTKGVFKSPDVMEEVFFNTYETLPDNHSDASYAYVTLHRAENTNEKSVMEKRIAQLASTGMKIIWSIHPRSVKQLDVFGIQLPPSIETIPPQSYGKNMSYIKNATYIFTDSGGLQKEAYWACVPCFTLRNETEWTDTVQAGWNTLVLEEDNLSEMIKNYSKPTEYYRRDPQLASKFIVGVIERHRV